MYAIEVLKEKQRVIRNFMKHANKSNSYPEGMILYSLEKAIEILKNAKK